MEGGSGLKIQENDLHLWMNHNEKAIEIVKDLLIKHGINKIVISPGGTNIPLVKKIQDDPFFSCYSVVDERSAIYFAIGIYLQTGEIVATSCTSAQATRNYIPGLTEAYYKRVPIIALTMEKHPRFVGQEYMQAPDQTSLPKDCIKASYELPYISNVHDEYMCIRIVNEAINEITHKGFGPVQLSIPWLDFRIAESKPPIRVIKRYSKFDKSIVLNNKRIMIVIGEHRPFTADEINAIETFTEHYDCVVYSNHLSNYSGKYTIFANLKLATMSINDFARNYQPDILISIGGQTGDYPFYLIFSKPELKSTEHWRINEDGKIIDTYDKLTKIFECSIDQFFKDATNNVTDSQHEYYHSFRELCEKTNIDVELPFSNAFAAQALHDKLPQSSIVQFSILNSLRVWNLFKLDPSIECYSNVGAFGIDGGMSTFIGQSVVTNKKCFLIIGDLAFYYDMNSLGIRHIRNNVRILLINNDGGVEFKLNNGDNSKTNKYIAASGHFNNAKGWAETCGFKYLKATNKNDFNNYVNVFTGDSDRPILFELFVEDKNDYLGYQKIIRANQNNSVTRLLKEKIRETIK